MSQSLFLPFTPDGARIERRAIGIKRDFGYGPYDPVGPFDLARRMGHEIVADDWWSGVPADLRRAVAERFGRSWSAGSIPVDGRLFVLANPSHAETRRAVSIMEELVHAALGHEKSRLSEIDGLVMRTCDHEVEDEAYAVATALLMPYRLLFQHVNAGEPLDELATPVPLSPECRLYRIKRAGLYKTMRARERGRAAAG